MNTLPQQLLSRKKQTYEKLKDRFLKNLSTGNIDRKTHRDKYRMVTKLQQIEAQLGIRSSTRLKHWAMALAIGLVSFAARAQTVPFRAEKMPSESSISGNMALADFDGDGDTDIVHIAYSGYHTIMLGDGAGGFGAQASIGIQSLKGEGFTHGDFDGDGDEDLLILEEYSEGIRVSVLSNDGSGAFTEAVAYYEAGYQISGGSLQAGDLDNDGDLDLLVQMSSSVKQVEAKTIDGGYGSWNVLLNDGAGNFSRFGLEDYLSSLSNSAVVLAADFDNDGDADIVSVNYSGYLDFYANDGDLTNMNHTSSSGVNYFYNPRVMAEDMDGDGNLDVVMGYSYAGDYLRVFFGNGAGSFDYSLGTSFQYLGEMSAIDADGDGSQDLLIHREPAEGTSEWQVYDVEIGVETLTLTGLKQTLTGKFGEPRTFYPGDFDNDGDDELLAANYYELILFENDGTGSFNLANDALINPVFATQTEVADLNGDGFPDLVGNKMGQIFINDGAGNFKVTQALANETGYVADYLTLGDLDGDGDVDVVFAGGDLNYTWGEHYSLSIQVALNDGKGNFTASEPYNLPDGYQAYAIVAVDLDADKDLDLAMITYIEGMTFSVLYNDGNAGFSFDQGYSIYDYNVKGLYPYGDIDGDGNMDLVIVSGSAVTTLVRTPELTWKYYEGPFFAESSIVSNYDFADLDGDGDLDVVLSNDYDYGDYLGKNIILQNDSSTASYFSNANELEISRATPSQDVQVADFDNDGDPDVLFADYSYGNALFLNDGTTGFVFAEDAGGPTIKSYSLSAGDFDGDGDTDLFGIGSNRNMYVIFNDLISAPQFEDTLFSVAENPLNGAAIGTFEALDLNEDPLTYTIVSGDDNGAFAISGSDLIVNDSSLFDFETTQTFILQVEVSDGSQSAGAAVTVTLTDVDEAPAMEAQAFEVAENQPAGTLIGTLMASDPEGDELVYTIVSGDDNGAFSISGSDLLVSDSAQFDFEATQTIMLEIAAVDDTLSAQAVVTITLTDVDEAPAMETQTFEVAENQPAGTLIGTLVASDPEGADVSYILVSGNEANVVAFDGATGEFSIADSAYFDFESATQMLLEITASDGTLNATNTVTINVININEQPVVANSLYRVDESQVEGAIIGTVKAEDPDGDELTYSFLNGNTDNAFVINGATGEISVNSPSVLDYDVTSDYLLTVHVTDGALTAQADIAVRITALERDKSALLDLFSSTDGTSWTTSTNWSESNELTEDWFGVTLSGGRVTGLSLPDNHLAGAIPESFEDLTGLTSVDISGNELTSIPGLTFLSGLELLDVSDNQMSITELLHNVGVSGYVYAPQKELGEAQADTVYAGMDLILTYPELLQNVGDSYQWYHNDVAVAGGNDKDLTITGLNYDQMGSYHLEIENSSLPDLTLGIAPQVIWVATDVTGTVYEDAQGNPLSSGQVDIYRIFDGPFELTDSATINQDGSYVIDKVVMGDFILLVKNDLISFPDVIQTYYVSTGDWQEADTLYLREAAELVDITMRTKPTYTPLETGADFEGTIESELEEETSEGGRILARRTVKRAGCSMRRFVSRGRAEQEGEYVDYAYVESDDEGRFNFEGIEPGKYLLNIQYPGVPMDPNSQIEFEISENEENILYQIEAVVTDDGIVVNSKKVLSSKKTHLKEVNLYPNPTNGMLRVDFVVYRSLNDLKVNVVDLEGKKLFDQELNARTGLQTVEIDLTSYQSGIYLLIFSDRGGSFSHVVKVSKN